MVVQLSRFKGASRVRQEDEAQQTDISSAAAAAAALHTAAAQTVKDAAAILETAAANARGAGNGRHGGWRSEADATSLSVASRPAASLRFGQDQAGQWVGGGGWGWVGGGGGCFLPWQIWDVRFCRKVSSSSSAKLSRTKEKPGLGSFLHTTSSSCSLLGWRPV